MAGRLGRGTGWLVALHLAIAAIASSAFARPAAVAPPICDASTSFTLIALDSRERSLLFALPGGGWMELRAGATSPSATLYPADSRVLRGASSGSGPVFVVVECGRDCLEVETFSSGRFETLGEPLVASARTSALAAYDHEGTPWVLLQQSNDGSAIDTRAFHLAGKDWKPAGTRRVTDVGHPGVHAAPGAGDAVTSGTGLFSASAEATTWPKGLPEISAARRGEIVSLGEDRAAYIAADGAVYRSSDRGATWRRVLWTPWSSDWVQIWTRSVDYDSELPGGALGPSLPMLWFDHRDPKAAPALVLSEMDTTGTWAELATLPAALAVEGGAPAEISEMVRFDDGSWGLFAGCSTRGSESRLLWETWSAKAGAKRADVAVTRAVP
ncbi:MAG: hypothetical protein ABI609_07410 [Acidobacteriota bacterium]